MSTTQKPFPTRALADGREPPFGAAHEREFAAVAAVHKQVLCIAAVLPGIPGVSSDLADATATLKERDAGERGQPVHQLVLESRVTGLCCGRLSLPVVPVAAAHGCGGVI